LVFDSRCSHDEGKRIMRPHDWFLSAALAATAWTPSLAQSNPQWTPRFGITGGANLATLTGSGFEEPSNRTGFAAGLMAVLPVAPSFAIQPELMFTMKEATRTRAARPTSTMSSFPCSRASRPPLSAV
jgi:hypothetical protein